MNKPVHQSWLAHDENALEQMALLQPHLTGCIAARVEDPPESGQFIWRRNDFRILWIARAPLYNIGCRGHFREQAEDGCAILVPPGLPVFFWREGNSSYCNDLEFDAVRCEAGRQPATFRSLRNLENAGEATLAFAAASFSLNEHLAKLAMPIFAENTILRVNHEAFEASRIFLGQLLTLSPNGQLLGSQILKTFVMALINGASASRQLVTSEIPREAAENPHIMEVLRIISERLDDHSLNLESIANAVHLNASYLSGLFSQLMRKTLVRYIQEKRVLAARRLLITNPHLSIKEIMAQVGINTPQQMSRTFKKILGCSPSEFRASIEDQLADEPGAHDDE